MPELARAKIVQIEEFSQDPAQPAAGTNEVEVQFNPESLKLSLSNRNSGGDQPGGSSTQFLGTGSSSLSVELLFDTSASGIDVRKRTEAIAYFIVGDVQREQNRVPPKVSFRWGSFIFEGVLESMDETLEYFSEEGIPLRATVALSMKRDAIILVNAQRLGRRTTEPGQGVGQVTPLQTARQGDSLQSMAGRLGKSGDWKAIAAANNIDDPLRLQPGALVDLNPPRPPGVRIG